MTPSLYSVYSPPSRKRHRFDDSFLGRSAAFGGRPKRDERSLQRTFTSFSIPPLKRNVIVLMALS